LVKILSLYDVTLNFVSPKSLMMPDSVKADLSRSGTQWAEYHNLDQVIAKSDVLYATRVQKERFESLAEYESVKDMFIINNDLLTKAKESAIVMHPLPRVNEIDPEVDFDSRRAAYFRQMRYGLFVSPLSEQIGRGHMLMDRSEWLCLPWSLALRLGHH
jgi:carbamoyl-phosphate synthase/aspartate carbamoyltransferase